MVQIKDGDSVVTAWSDKTSGPGWSNAVVWVLVRERAGALRLEALQPKEQTDDLLDLCDWSALAHYKMRNAADAALKRAVERALRGEGE